MSINDYRLYGPRDAAVVEDAAETGEETLEPASRAPTSANRKQEIYDYLVGVGYTEEDLAGLTKADLLDMI